MQFITNPHNKLLLSIFLIAIALRICLSIANEEANDNHFEVIKIIKDEGHLPAKGRCAESFQPKLYHVCAAAVLKLLPFSSCAIQKRIAQIINCIAGIITIYIVYLFLINVNLNNNLKTICFSLIALNPKLIGINAQATNDSFVILFSTLTLYFTYRFFAEKKFTHFLYMTAFAILAGLSKGTGLVLFPSILLIFTARLLKNRNLSLNFKKGYLSCSLIFSFLFLGIVPFLGQYWYEYHHFTSPFIPNGNKNPSPQFIKKTYYGRPGVTSIIDSYFTFRLLDLIKHPAITNGRRKYSLHRTSLWSQLYGRSHFIYFDRWPPGWQTKNKIILDMGRLIFILALVPTFILLLGIIKELNMWVNAVIKRKFDFIENTNEWVFDIFFGFYIFFIIVLTLRHRDFAFMKAIYLFPALLAALHLFIKGIGYIKAAWGRNRKLSLCLNYIFGMLFFLYFLTTTRLIYKLSLTYF